MINSVARSLSRFKVVNQSSWGYLLRKCSPSQSSILVISERSKHWNPKFRKERAMKVVKVNLPDYDEPRRNQDLTPEQLRTKMKEKGIAPRRSWDEKPICVSCTGAIFEPYVPPEGDGKVSLTSSRGVKQKTEEWGKKGKSYMALRKIRQFQYDFDVPLLAEKCQEVYLAAHKALQEMDEDKLHELVTEKCYPEMVENVKNKTIRWNFIESLEIPRVVHIRNEALLGKENLFSQATVRFHSRQTLAVYDRFGRLMHGSEDVVKDVLEYVVFEKHLPDMYGGWRIHAKIIPDWQPPREPILKTYVNMRQQEEVEAEATEVKPESAKAKPESGLELESEKEVGTASGTAK